MWGSGSTIDRNPDNFNAFCGALTVGAVVQRAQIFPALWECLSSCKNIAALFCVEVAPLSAWQLLRMVWVCAELGTNPALGRN